MKKLLRSKILVAVITAAGIASPAFAHSGSQHERTARLSGLHAYAMVPPDAAYNPALNGGGSVGYNANLRQDRW